MPLRTVRILCFGDSLTAGYTDGGYMYHPYAHTMMKTLRMAFPEIKLDISVKGEPGDEVIPPQGEFYPRLQAEWTEAIEFNGPYDWVLLLGGTNDLASDVCSPEDVFGHLKKLYDMCFSHGAKVVAMTVPECGADVDWLNKKRDALNDMIKNYPRDNLHVFDLHAAIPYHNLSLPKRNSIWDDGVHLTTTGYSIMGDKVAEFFLPLLKAHIDAMPRDPPSPVSPSVLVTTMYPFHNHPSNVTAASTAAAMLAKAAAAAPPQPRLLLPPLPLPLPLPPPSSSSSSVAAAGAAVGAAAVAHRRPGAKSDFADDINFDEEDGDHTVLSQGYIIVRKRDLD